MKTKLIILLILTSTFLKAQDGGDYCSEGKIKSFSRLSKLSSVQYPGDSNIDVTYYNLNLTLVYSTHYLSGIVIVKAKATIDNLQNFYLDLVNSMNVLSVTSNGVSLTYLLSNNQLQITLDKQYQTGQEFSVEISYSGYPLSGNFGDFVFSSHSNQRIIWSLSEPYGARAWWPSKDTPADKADSSEVWITSDPFFVSVSNGVLIGTVNNQDGTRTYKWKNSYPIANYLISLAMTNYQIYDTPLEYEPDKIMSVTHYVYPEQFTFNKSNLDKINGMINLFSLKFGLYPFIKEKYGQAQCHNGVSMEHQTVSSMSTFDENVEAHELAHQWFGDKVTCKDWQNIWLNEGFASYCECIYREGIYGIPDFKNYVNNFMIQAKNAVGTIYVKNINDVMNEIFNSARSYKKGGIVLHMLRGVVGDSAFFQIMRQYANEPGLAYNVATTEDFQRIAERVSGMNLNYFFQEWIYGDSYPKYTIGWSTNQISGNSYNLHLRAKQNTNPSNNPTFFKMPIQVKYVTTLETKTITVFNDVQDQGWEIAVNGQPTSVTFDPDNWILKDIVGTTSIEDVNEIPTTFSLSQNYPNPFNPSTLIGYQLPEASHVSLKIYDELGREIATLVNEYQQTGNYNFQFSISNLPAGRQSSQLSSGVYFYTLKAGEFVETKKMILLK